MTQREAATILMDNFYEWIPSKIQFNRVTGKPELYPKLRIRGNVLVLPTTANRTELMERRDQLIPRSFRFTWLNLPKGARYITSSVDPATAPASADDTSAEANTE